MWQQYNMTWIYHDIFVPSFYKIDPAKKQKIHKVFQIQWTRSDQNYVYDENILWYIILGEFSISHEFESCTKFNAKYKRTTDVW
jgi:hypothetical protein